jgi:hypothetical protein
MTRFWKRAGVKEEKGTQRSPSGLGIDRKLTLFSI